MSYPSTWETVTIGESLDLINGRAFKPSEWTSSGRPIIRIQNLNNPKAAFNYFEGELPGKFLVATGDLLFAWSGTPGTSFGAHVWKGPEAWLNQHIFKVVFPSAVFDKSFLQLAINQNLAQYIGVAHGGAGLAHITKGKFEASLLPLPPLPEQKRIVAKIEELFSELEAGEESLRVARRQLGVYRQSLLKQAFEGKLTAHWRSQNLVKDSTWSSTTVGQIGRIETGTTPPTENQANYGGDLPFFKPTDLEQGRYVKTARSHLSVAGRKSARVLPAGSTLVTCIGATIGKTGLAQLACATNQQINSISPAEDIAPEFAYFQVISPQFQEQIKTNASSTTLPILNKSKFSALPFVRCSLPEQQEIVRVLDEQFEGIERNEREIDGALRSSAALRQAILQKAFTGRLVPQDASDEPASVLLARLRDQKMAVTTAHRTPRKAAGDDWFPEIAGTRRKPKRTRKTRRPGTTDLQAGIVALAIDCFGRRRQFLGHTNAEKVVHLADCLADLQLDREPVKDAAGPNDFPRVKEVEHRAHMKHWFTAIQRGEVWLYQPGRNLPALLETTRRKLGPKLLVIDRLLETLRGLDTRQIEVRATVYAAWNNLLLRRVAVSDEAIVTEARENWHERKLGIERPLFFEAIGWLRERGFVPRGTGRLVDKPRTG